VSVCQAVLALQLYCTAKVGSFHNVRVWHASVQALSVQVQPAHVSLVKIKFVRPLTLKLPQLLPSEKLLQLFISSCVNSQVKGSKVTHVALAAALVLQAEDILLRRISC